MAKQRHFRYVTSMMHRLGRFCFALILLASPEFLSACESSRGNAVKPSATLVTVIPQSFAGEVVCGSFDGAWQTYTAVLTDVTAPESPVALPSSELVNCAMPVSFASVEPGHRYTARINAYDRSDLVPLGGEKSGSGQMADPKTGEPVEPRWTASCGSSQGNNDGGNGETDGGENDGVATLCIANNAMPVRDCTLLKQVQATERDTSLYIDLARIRGVLECGEESGQVYKIVVSPMNGTLNQTTATCDERVTFDKLKGNTSYYFDIMAYESGKEGEGEHSWATRCVGTTKEGISLPVGCDPLTDRGALRFDMQKHLASMGRECGDDDIMSYRLTLSLERPENYTKACHFPIILSNLKAGSYEFLLKAYGASQDLILKGKCNGEVIIGRQQDITCDFEAES